MLTSEFIVSFEGKKEVIEEWLQSSDGTMDVTPKKEADCLVYSVTPGEGAAFAEIRYYRRLNKIVQRTYWS